MEDFIRPKQNQVIKPKKKKKNHIRETLFIIFMIACLAIGFVTGYFANRDVPGATNSSVDAVISEAYNVLKENWLNTSDEKIDIRDNTIAALVSSLGDKHSSFLTYDESKEYNQSVDGVFVGIGVVQRLVSEGTMIIEIYKDSPADKGGLKIGDIITGVDGKSVAGLSSNDITNLVRGDEGTKVTLSIIRDSKVSDIVIKRESVDSAVASEIRDNNGKKYGYVKINTFGTTTATDLENAMKDFTKQQIDTLVLDLRGNGGGYLTAAIDVLSLFIDSDKVIFQIENKSGKVEKYKSSDCKKYHFLNGYILVNGTTASASEVTAGTLQEQLGYKLVGDQTYGKGTAQTQKSLSDGSVLKYTYAKWLLASGTWIDGKGLTPDYSISNISTSDIYTYKLENDMGFDSVGSQISSMQKMLNTLGYSCGRDDGYFSQQTVEALKQFEQAKNLTVDGVYNNDDRLLLEATFIIFANSEQNDSQYHKLLELIR